MASSTLSLAQDLLNRYAMPICMILGNIGNACNVFVFSKHRQNACSMYLMSASIMNIFFLTFIITFSMYIYDHGDPTVQSPIFCKIRVYLPHVWGQMGRYFIVLAPMPAPSAESDEDYVNPLTKPAPPAESDEVPAPSD